MHVVVHACTHLGAQLGRSVALTTSSYKYEVSWLVGAQLGRSSVQTSVNERPHDNYGCKYEEFTRSGQQTMR
jgi:hypothetical protein